MLASAALIWSPFADESSARVVIDAVLTEKLVACANIVAAVRSVYLWQGRIEEGTECGVLFKTTGVLLDSATARIAALHPYDTPVVIGWQADAAPPATLAWLANNLGNAGILPKP